MKEISNEELAERVELHELWLDTKSAEGEKLILEGYDLGGKDLMYLKLTDAILCKCHLVDASLDGASLDGANLEGANLHGASLRGANLWCAMLLASNLDGANLDGANLGGADLEGANLEDTDIRYVIGDGHKVRGIRAEGLNYLDGYKYHMCYTDTDLAIGCQQHPIKQWLEFSDEEIAAMDDGAVEWWYGNRDAIIRYIRDNPAK